MKIDFAVLRHQTLEPGLECVFPSERVPRTGLDAPARELMTDFRQRWPETVGPAITLEAALEKMKRAGVRLLLVTDEDETVLGAINAEDILGDRPIRAVREQGIARDELTVAHVMSACSAIEVVDMGLVENSRVGHIIATLNGLRRRHLLVVEAESGRPTRIRGLFSATEIGKRTGLDVNDVEGSAESLLEIQAALTS